MVHPKSPLSSLHIFSSPMNKSSTSSTSSSSSSVTTMKVKTLIHNLIFSHICRVIRALSKAKSFFLEIFRENQLMYLNQNKKKNKYRKKILFGSFRLHYNWCSSSSHVLPIIPSPPILEGIHSQTSHIYYDSTWNSLYATEDADHHHHHHGHDHHHHHHGHDEVCAGNKVNGKGKEEEVEGHELSSYLQWLEEKSGKVEILKEDEVKDIENEIDKLADMFIANCHEKFRLEKIESYRRYQELLARTL